MHHCAQQGFLIFSAGRDLSIFKCWREGASRENSPEGVRAMRVWEGIKLTAGARRSSSDGRRDTSPMAHKQELWTQLILSAWWQKPRSFHESWESKHQIWILWEAQHIWWTSFIHFCNSYKKEADIFFILDYTDSLQSKITSFQSNPVAELTSDLSVPFIEHASFPNWETVK